MGIRVRPSQEGEGYGRKGRSELASRGDDAITTRLGAVALPLGVFVIAVSEYFHPAREDWEERKTREIMDKEEGS